MKKILFSMLFSLLIIACTDSENTNFTEVSYFRTDNAFRVYTVETVDTATLALCNYAEQLNNTAGRPTVVYFYKQFEGINPTALNDYSAIIETCDASDYYLKWWKNPNGGVVWEKK